jgi:hypothetical protein
MRITQLLERAGLFGDRDGATNRGDAELLDLL